MIPYWSDLEATDGWAAGLVFCSERGGKIVSLPLRVTLLKRRLHGRILVKADDKTAFNFIQKEFVADLVRGQGRKLSSELPAAA